MALQPILLRPSSRPNQPPFPLTPKTTRRLIAAAAGGSDGFPFCPICGGHHSESFDCRPPWLAEHFDSRDPGIPNH